MTVKPLIAGNWKMYGDRNHAALVAVAYALAQVERPELWAKADLLICPPFTLIASLAEPLRAAGVRIGGQNCAGAPADAQTGEISAAMLADLGCSHVILGHSERRRDLGETDALVQAKLAEALAAGLTAIVCVGETAADRSHNRQEAVVEAQLTRSLPDLLPEGRVIIAYEPVWAIGTGQVASPLDIAAMHGFIRGLLIRRYPHGGAMQILYGGSVKPANAAEILATPNVNGVLVGGASRKPDEFLGIAAAVA